MHAKGKLVHLARTAPFSQSSTKGHRRLRARFLASEWEAAGFMPLELGMQSHSWKQKGEAEKFCGRYPALQWQAGSNAS